MKLWLRIVFALISAVVGYFFYIYVPGYIFDLLSRGEEYLTFVVFPWTWNWLRQRRATIPDHCFDLAGLVAAGVDLALLALSRCQVLSQSGF